MFYYRINKNHALIQYNKQDLSNNIKSIDYLEFEIKEHKFKLLPYHINILLEEFKEDTLQDILHKLNEATEYLSYKTLEEIYYEIDNKDEVPMYDWYDFDEEFFETFLHDATPYEISRMTYFGKIHSWGDPYISFNAYGNLETTDQIDYKSCANEILQQWLIENL